MMESLKTLLQNKSFSSPLIKGVKASQIISAAEKVLTEIFGEEISEHVNPAYFKNGTLTFACLSTTVAQELKIREAEIMQKINTSLSGNNVTKFKYLT